MMGKTVDELRAEVKAAREEMVDAMRGLSSEIHPSIIRQRTGQHIKDAAKARVNDVKTLVVDETGIRWDHIGTVALATMGLLAIISAVRSLGRLFSRF